VDKRISIINPHPFIVGPPVISTIPKIYAFKLTGNATEV